MLRPAMELRLEYIHNCFGPDDCVGSAEMGQTALLANLVTENKDCEWIYRFRANPGWAVGRHRAAPAGLGPWVGARVASPRCPYPPYPPPWLPQCNPEGYDRANSFSLDLARRLALALASFSLRAAQMASARPASLSAGVM